MAVQSSGADLSMEDDIVAEFGGSAPHAISEYYGGAGLVPAGANGDVPTSGQIKFSQMYGTVAATVLTISSSANNLNIKTLAVAAGGDQNTPVIMTINSGVTIGSTSPSTPALITDTGWGSGTTINITNNGSIVGSSGQSTSANPSGGGGNGGSAFQGNHWQGNGTGQAGQAGSTGSGSAGASNNGSPAFTHSQPGSNLSVIFDVAGTRTAGSAAQATFTGNGGGGGAGRGLRNQVPHNPQGYWWVGGTGGGGGAHTGQGGQGNNAWNSSSNEGQNGGATSGGSGGARYPSAGSGGGTAGQGGSGGNLQSAGQGGNSGNYGSNGAGGSAGSNGTASGQAGQALAGNTSQIS